MTDIKDPSSTIEDLLLYRALLESMNEGFGVVDHQNRFTYVNRRFAEMLSYAPKEMVGKRLVDFLDATNKEILEDNVRKREEGKASQYELEWLSQDGELISTIVSGAPLLDEHGEHMGSFAVITDIRDRRRLETALRDSEANYRAIAENSLQGITVIQDERYVYVNQAFADIVDYSIADIMRMSSENQWNLIHKEDRSFLLQLAEDRNAGREVPATYEYRFVTRDGSTRWVQAFSSKIQYDGKEALQVFLIDITERRKVEDALRESEAKYRALTEQSIQALAIMQDMGVAYANPAYAKLVGLSIEEIMKLDRKGVWNLLHPDDKDRLRGRFEQYTESGDLVPRTTYRIIRPDGDVRWVESHVSIIEFSGKPAMQMALIDITDKMLAEENMRASQEMLELVMNSIPTFIYWKDTNSVYLGCNENFARVAGVGSPEQIIGKTDFDLAWKREEADSFIELDREVMDGAEPQYHRVEPQLQADGKQAWLEINRIPLRGSEGEVIGMLGTYEDITERVMQEEAIRKSEIKYRTLAEQSLQGLIIMSDTGLEYVNRTFADMMGWSIDELLNMDQEDVWKLVHPSDMPLVRERTIARLAGASLPPGYEYRMVTRDGETLWVEGYVTSIEYNSKPALQSVIIDTTDRRRVEREVRAAKDRAMLYMDLLGHDVRNQLQVILNSAALMRTATNDETKDAFLNVIEDSVTRCSRLIEEVKSTENLLTEPLIERSLTESLQRIVQAMAGRSQDIILDTSISEAKAVIMADDYLELLLSNILMNAVEHNPKEVKRVWVSLRQESDGFLITVGDNGPGISESRKEELFDVARRFGGIGLHQSSQILEKYEGWIQVHDRVNGKPQEGAEFRLWFPKPAPKNGEIGS